jgi:hypothetical protein
MMNEFHQLDENGLNNKFKYNMGETRCSWLNFIHEQLVKQYGLLKHNILFIYLF